MAINKSRLAIIISQEKFENPIHEERKGNECDVKEIESALILYGFTVRNYKDRIKEEILQILNGVAGEDHSNTECVVVIVLSHGNNKGLILAKDQEFHTKDVWEPFRDCDTLKDIPKVFIFQACRGLGVEKGLSANSISEEPRNVETSTDITEPLPHKPAFVLVHSTLPDLTAKSNQENGSIFIQTLCNELKTAKQHEEVDFLKLLTEVNSKIAIDAESDGKSQTSTFKSFLRQPLILKKIDDYEKRTDETTNVSNDAAGGKNETSYNDGGKRFLLILYTEMFADQAKEFKRTLDHQGHQHFQTELILVNDTDVLSNASQNINFENAGSLTVFVLAELSENTMISAYCEKLSIKFSATDIHPNVIWSQFTASQCCHLRGKPKMFLFCDLLERKDSDTKNITPILEDEKLLNTESVNNHSDFLWAYCYGKKMFEEIKSALLNSDEEITQLLTTAMRNADSTSGSAGIKISYFESTLRQKFYFNSSPQQTSIVHLRRNMEEASPLEPAASQSSDDSVLQTQEMKEKFDSIIKVSKLQDTLDLVDAFSLTTKQNIIEKYNKKCMKVRAKLQELDLSDPALKEVHQEHEAYLKEIEKALQKLKHLSEPLVLLQDICEEITNIKKEIKTTFDDVRDSGNYKSVLISIEKQKQELDKLKEKGNITDIQFSKAFSKLDKARQNLEMKAMEKEEKNKKLVERFEAMTRDRNIIKNVKQNINYLKVEVMNSANNKYEPNYHFLKDDLIRQIHTLDGLECKDDKEIRQVYKDRIAEAQRLLNTLEQEYMTEQPRNNEELNVENIMQKLMCINEKIDALPDQATNYDTQNQHLKFTLHQLAETLGDMQNLHENNEKREKVMSLLQQTREKLEIKYPKFQSNETNIVAGSATYKKPLQLLILDGHGRWNLDMEALSSVVCQPNVRDRKVVVLSVVGKFRRGKSFLLNFMLRYLSKNGAEDWLNFDSPDILKGFEWRRDNDQVTEGIVIWPEAFIVGNFAVILLDTEGTSDPKSTMVKNTLIFTLSTLVSSVQVLNIYQRFELDDLIQMKGFVDYGKSFAKASKDNKVFQKLILLVRDWGFPEKVAYGSGGKALWKEQKEKQQDMTSSVKRCFENVQCFLLPKPGEVVENSIEFKGEIRDINREFLHYMRTLIESIFNVNRLVPKRIGLSYVTAKDLVSIVSSFCNELQNCKSTPETLLQLTGQLHCRRLLELAAKNYIEFIKAGIASAPDVQKLHEKAIRRQKEAIHKETFLVTTISQFEKELESRLEVEYMRVVQPFLDERKRKHKEKLRSTLENAKHNYENTIQKCLLSEEFYNLEQVNETIQEEIIRTFSFVTGYSKPGLLGAIVSKGKSYFVAPAQAQLEYDDLLCEFKLYADNIYSTSQQTLQRKLKEQFEHIVNEATEIYRTGMKNVSSTAQDPRKLHETHTNAEKQAKEHLKSKTTKLMKYNEASTESGRFGEYITNIYREIKEQNEEKLRMLLEKVKNEVLACYDKKMNDWMSHDNGGCDMQIFATHHVSARDKALNHFKSCNLDGTDSLYVQYLKQTKQDIKEKMERIKHIYRQLGKPRAIQMAKQKYENIMESHEVKTTYIVDIKNKHEEAKREALQYLQTLYDENSKELEIEANELIEKTFQIYVGNNNSKKMNYFQLILEKFKRNLDIETTVLKEKIRQTWQRNLEKEFRDIAEKCKQDVFNVEEQPKEYISQLEKSKQYIAETWEDLKRKNDEKKEEELNRAERSVQEAIQEYASFVKIKLGTFRRIPEYNDIVQFHEPAKSSALQKYRNAIKNLSIDICESLKTKLEEGIDKTFEGIILSCNLDRRAKGLKEESDRFAVGIDLGTTNSCVAVFRNEKVERIKSSYNSYTTPSVVYYGSKKPIVGEAAVYEGQTDFKNCISGVKRIIGRPYNDREVKAMKRNSTFEIVERDGQPNIRTKGQGGERCLKVEEVSAEVLKEMKQIAFRHLGYGVVDAVVTVPAYFNISQGAATLRACDIAGLNVLSLVNEPTAVAVAFGFQFKNDSLRRVLVYDLGGGTCDVSIVEVTGGHYEVKDSCGNNTLGGRDFDQRLLEHVVGSKELGGKPLDEAMRSRIKHECERAKKKLSFASECEMFLPHICGSDFRMKISREKFEEICSALFDEAMKPVDDCLESAKFSKKKIDEVILAGGSSYIPKIKEMLKEKFDGKEINDRINPDEAIAFGAALRANTLANPTAHFHVDEITPYSLGTDDKNGKYSIIVKKGTKIPCRITGLYKTCIDYQDKVSVQVFQGESTVSNENWLIGEFELDNIRKEKAGKVKIDVSFKIDENGILEVTAEEKDRKNSKTILVGYRVA